MKQLGTLALKVLGFFAFVFAFWKWGETSAKLKASEKRADEAVKNSQDFEDINSEPYIDNPADLLCYDESEYPDIPEDAKEIGNEAEQDS